METGLVDREIAEVKEATSLLRQVATESFLDKFMVLSEADVSDAFQKLCEGGQYSTEHEHWKEFPAEVDQGGLVICYDEMTVLLCDRSGTIATATSININKDPLNFIRIIGGISSMKPEQLGWDIGMKLYKHPAQEIVPSYEAGFDFRGEYGNSPFHLHWVIEAIVDGAPQRYLTIGTLSAPQVLGMCGRATLVFEVVKYDERFDPKETFALKRYWRPVPANAAKIQTSDLKASSEPTGINDEQQTSDQVHPTEGEFYDIIYDEDDDRPEFKCVHHDVTLVGGAANSTFETIRRSLILEPPLPERQSSPDYYSYSYNGRGSSPCYGPYGMPFPKENLLPEPVEHIHHQILMPTGIPILYFCHIRELLSVLLDCIKDHRHAHAKYILHRDISIGNLMIFAYTSDDFERTYGRLMDFDHAKRVTNASPPLLTPVDEAFLPRAENLIKLSYEGDISRDLMVQAWGYVKFLSGSYIQDVFNTRRSYFELPPKEGELTSADLGWYDEDVEWPDFEDGESKKPFGERALVGTPPFMSAEVLAGYTFSQDHKKRFYHNANHDMESFLWVLINICVVRSGPGKGMARPENSEGLLKCVHDFFDGDYLTLEKSKWRLLENPKRLDSDVLEFFHPYFEDLKPLVRQWWAVLVLAYQYRANEFYHIHKHIIRILENSIAALQDPPIPHEATVNELRRRKEQHQRSLHTFQPVSQTDNVTATSCAFPMPPANPNPLKSSTQKRSLSPTGPLSLESSSHVAEKRRRIGEFATSQR
ncbi:hypothetical protein H0H81_012543 [Sphagnurus paluster]|uniref:Protein kinase domain-containing protein n=1 Tax=Sphagnurus paluster TaxID=117069 RepID=A0A9P7KFJ0_9AGAR|nr:hypothetical protein H0H81_012543 [Sphagnurus paluster]